MSEESADLDALAIRIARLYYYQGLTTVAIAEELGSSRSTVSRLLSRARDKGLVEIHIHDPQDHPARIETRIKERHGLAVAKVVAVPEAAGERVWLERVASHAAGYLNTLIAGDMVVGVAWGTTVKAIAECLTPKPVVNLNVVQLNGSGTAQAMESTIGSDILQRFAANYGAHPHAFPVPAFFDFAETRTALWRERSVKRLLALQRRADILLYSIGAFSTQVPSLVHNGGFLGRADIRRLQQDGVVGDIATVFFRADGSHEDVQLNARASGPDLKLLQRARHSICVVSGTGKVEGLRAALRGGFINELIIDEPTARLLLADDPASDGSQP
ncbi:MAG: sugar-binding transcriptional regulator [Sulfuritalea sp.]|nr:sugar-binding transcriptional regulator [Sulfuritalea sp.]MDP1981403.1 sugar-binding transcriptional regulator [Sulfuritalea sp.]